MSVAGASTHRARRAYRGRTRPSRLAALDRWLTRYEPELLSRRDGAFASASVIDVGLGEDPGTTLELAAALEAVAPGLTLVGVEADPRRAARARTLAAGAFSVREGELERVLPLEPPARLVRAMNVLRSQPPARIPELHARLSEPLVPGGLLLEGTSDAEGHVLVAHLIRRTATGAEREAMLFYTDGASGFAPILFRDHLPRDLRRRVESGQPIHELVVSWTLAWQAARADGVRSACELFARAAELLATRRGDVSPDPWLAENGYLLWRPVSGAANG